MRVTAKLPAATVGRLRALGYVLEVDGQPVEAVQRNERQQAEALW